MAAGYLHQGGEILYGGFGSADGGRRKTKAVESATREHRAAVARKVGFLTAFHHLFVASGCKVQTRSYLMKSEKNVADGESKNGQKVMNHLFLCFDVFMS